MGSAARYGEVARWALWSAIDVAVVVVVTEVPRSRVDDSGAVRSPAHEPFTLVHASLVLGSQLDVGGSVAALLPRASRSVVLTFAGLASSASCADLHQCWTACRGADALSH